MAAVEQHDAAPVLQQLERGDQPRDAGPDDEHVGSFHGLMDSGIGTGGAARLAQAAGPGYVGGRSWPMTHRRLLALFVGLAAIACSSSPALAATHGPRHSDGRGSSTNWSGYAVAGSSATHVVGTWTQPVAICSSGENSWSSPWVGIDGDNSNTVEQIGTDSDCSGGAPYYYAWYEMYPKSLVLINPNAVRVQAGDSFTAEVTYRSTNSSYLLTLTNNTTLQTFSTSQASRKARRTSVEWVMEGP